MDRRTVIASALAWLPFAIMIIGISAMVYLAVQQNYRSSANDPQIQIALDARAALNNGATPQNIVPNSPDAQIDISQSLAPFVILYDAKGQVAASSAVLANQTPALPHGVLDDAKATGMNLITWSPGHGVRAAIVVLPYANGYVLAGRSIRYVEQREDALNAQVGIPCVATLLLSFAAILLTRLLGRRMDLGM